MTDQKNDKIREAVRQGYAAAAQASGGETARRSVAASCGYAASDLDAAGDSANLGLACGNPLVFADLRPGETVLDLGSGAGLDVILAAQAVGPEGRAIGVDMTPEMLERARSNAAARNIANAGFLEGVVEALPVADGEADAIISNCVVNLSADKARAFAEMARALKPGGRIAISDIIAVAPLPDALRDSLTAYVGCLAGALTEPDWRAYLTEAGFRNIQIRRTDFDLNVYGEIDGQTACCGPAEMTPVRDGLREVIAAHDLNDFCAAAEITAQRA